MQAININRARGMLPYVSSLQMLDMTSRQAIEFESYTLGHKQPHHNLPAPILTIRHGCLWQLISEEEGVVHERVVAP